LPAALTLDASTGVISGTPPAAGTFTFFVQVIDSVQSTATGTFSLTINAPPLSITTVPPLFAGTVGAAYSQPFSAAGGKPPYTWSIPSGAVPGLTIDTSAGNLHGTPQTAGNFDFVLQVSDTANATISKSFTIAVNAPVLSIASLAGLPPGVVGEPYSQKLPIAAVGGTEPYQWSIAGNAPPAPGLDFNAATLMLSGVPAAADTFTFTIRVTDGNRQSATKTLTLAIAPAALTITTNRQLPDGAINASYTCAVEAFGGASPYTWSAAGLPAGLTIDGSTGIISGSPAAAGTFSLAITVTDKALNHVSDRFTLAISLPAAPAVSISGLPQTAAPAQQYALIVALASAFPAPITGQAILAFAPDSGPTDKTIQFASGGTVANFSIPAGSTTAVTDVPLAIQTGTVCGTVNVSLRLQAGGIDITPASVPAASAQISRAAPVIGDVRVTRSSSQISIIVSGYSTAREITQASFTFSAAGGQTLQTSSIAIPVETLFGSWFQDPANGVFGSQFVLTQPFTVQGDPAAVLPQSVTLSNRVGSVTFQIR
jgi:hypothetical protein